MVNKTCKDAPIVYFIHFLSPGRLCLTALCQTMEACVLPCMVMDTSTSTPRVLAIGIAFREAVWKTLQIKPHASYTFQILLNLRGYMEKARPAEKQTKKLNQRHKQSQTKPTK